MDITEQAESFLTVPLDSMQTKPQAIKNIDLIDFESCRDEFLPYRKQYISNKHSTNVYDEEYELFVIFNSTNSK